MLWYSESVVFSNIWNWRVKKEKSKLNQQRLSYPHSQLQQHFDPTFPIMQHSVTTFKHPTTCLSGNLSVTCFISSWIISLLAELHNLNLRWRIGGVFFQKQCQALLYSTVAIETKWIETTVAYPERPACRADPPCRWSHLCSGRSCWTPLWTPGSETGRTWRRRWRWPSGGASWWSFPWHACSTWWRLDVDLCIFKRHEPRIRL